LIFYGRGNNAVNGDIMIGDKVIDYTDNVAIDNGAAGLNRAINYKTVELLLQDADPANWADWKATIDAVAAARDAGEIRVMSMTEFAKCSALQTAKPK
jgi:hypothetical protein